MRERDHSSACEKDSSREGTLREDWPVVDGGWRHAGTVVDGGWRHPCELVREWHFLGSGVLAKQLRSWRKGMGVERERERERAGWGGGGRESKVSARSAP
jgi:hypothetical protein